MHANKTNFMRLISTLIITSGFVCVSVNAFALAWNSPGVVPVQNSIGQWIDATTRQYISIQGMPTGGTPAPTPTPPTGTPAPAPAPAPTTGGGGAPTASPSPTSTGGIKATAGRVAGGALGVVGVAAGTMGVIDSVSGTGEHSWGNVLEGTVSGATAAAGGAAVVNALPGIGQVGYGVAIASGAVIGGVIAGSQLFSETDCLQDPVTGKLTCCNTVFNKGERQVEIGGYMFCGDQNKKALAPGVRQCLQGGKPHEAGWWDGLWQDDEWSKECTPRLCDGVIAPKSGTAAAAIAWQPDTTKICWRWTCASNYTKQNNTCIKNNSNGSTPPETDNISYDKIIQKIQQIRHQIQTECEGTM